MLNQPLFYLFFTEVFEIKSRQIISSSHSEKKTNNWALGGPRPVLIIVVQTLGTLWTKQLWYWHFWGILSKHGHAHQSCGWDLRMVGTLELEELIHRVSKIRNHGVSYVSCRKRKWFHLEIPWNTLNPWNAKKKEDMIGMMHHQHCLGIMCIFLSVAVWKRDIWAAQ